MEKHISNEIYKDLNIGNEQVTSNECWVIDEEYKSGEKELFDEFDIGNEQVSSNECFEEEGD